MPSVLFICTANLCRSPMAEALFKARLRLNQVNAVDWRVESAGTWTQDGLPATRNAREVMTERGLDLTQHKSREVTQEMLEQFNLILVMESNHKEALYAEFPKLSGRIYLLSEMAGVFKTVDDPVGGELSAYRDCADEIDAWIERGWAKILKLA